jgi:hypothetical protein
MENTINLMMNYETRFRNLTRGSKPRVYFAGKIGQNDWRHSLIGGDLRNAIFSGDDDGNLFNPGFTLECEQFIYCGPFFVACDHGCAHGANQHGAIGGCCDDSFHGALTDWHARIFNINLLRLRQADLVFAYIESADAYGTLIELGMAHSWRIPIGLRLPPEICADMWMVSQTAERIYRGPPAACFREFCRDFLPGAQLSA